MPKMPHKPATPPKHGPPVGTKMTTQTFPTYSKGSKSVKGYAD